MMDYALNRFKYVFNRSTGKLSVFPEYISHDSMGTGWTSAGFLRFTVLEDSCNNKYLGAECWGKSVSLKLESNNGDSEEISRLIRPELF